MARAGYGDLEVGAETSSVQAVHPVGTAAAPGIAFSTDTDVGLYRIDANELGISVGGTGQVAIIDGVLQPITTNDVDLGTADLQFKNAWFDGTLEADAITVGGVSVATGTNATTFTITAVSDDDTVYPVFVEASSGATSPQVDTGFTFNPSTNILIAPGEIEAASLDISGDADIDGTLEADAITVNGSSLASVIAGTTVTTATNATNITVADSTDTTCFVGLWESVTGAQAPKSDLGLTYNAGTGMLTATGFTGPLTGNAATASSAAILTTARDIGGVSFNGSASIDLPGVNTGGNQATSGLAATATLAASATKLATTRAIGGVNFDGTAPIDLPGVNTAGNQATSGLAATATLAAVSTAVTITDNEDDDEDNVLVFVAGADSDGGNVGLESDGHLHYNPSTGKLTATSFAGDVTGTITGTTSQINITAVTDNDTVYPVFVTGTSGSNDPEVATALTYNPSTGLLTATGFAGPITGNLTGTLQTAVQAGITTVGTIDTGVWEGTTVAVDQGGTGITSFGTGVATFMGTPSSANLRGALTDETGTGEAVFATSPTLVTPVLGTPQSGDLSSCTGKPSLGVVLALS